MQTIISNELIILRESLARCLAEPTHASPLAEDWILVGNRDTGRWLQASLTDALGGLANTRFMTITQALAALSATDSTTDLTGSVFWSVTRHWSAMHPTLASEDRVAQTLLLTERFTQYLTERPDWLLSWEQGQHPEALGDHWQGALWRAIVQDLEDRPHHRLLDVAKGRRQPQLETLGRVLIFAPERLSALAYQTFQRVDQTHPVWMWLQSPSPEIWFLERDAGMMLDHPLLCDLGTERSRLLRTLSEISPTEGYCEPLAGASHALAQLKDALYRNQRAEHPIPHDASIRLVAATSPTQEVEALKTWLVEYLNQAPEHSLADITLVSPNPGLYGPLVQRLFHGTDARTHIPTAADPLQLQSAHDASLAYLMASRRNGFRANRVLSFLSVDAVRTLFALSDRDIRLIESWLIASGARRGLEGHKHSLSAAKARLLRGLVVDAACGVEAKATPTEPLEQSPRLDILMAVLEATEAVQAIPNRLRGSEAAAQMTACLSRLTLDELKALEIPPLPGGVADLEIDFNDFLAYLSLQQRPGAGRPVALNDQLSVTSPQTIRAMHWPVVAILGANDGTFPSDAAPHAWDLIAHHPRVGDLSVAESERQALLDILLNTDARLWISWQGQHPISLNEELPGAAVMSLLSALNPDPKAQKAWIERLPTGLTLPPQQPIPAPIRHSSAALRTDWTRDQLIEVVQDPARVFLKQKGASLNSPPDDRLAQEPLTLNGLDNYRLRDLFLTCGRTDLIETWLKWHPEFPPDLDPKLLETLTPENIQIARSKQGPQYPNTRLTLGPYRLDIRHLPLASVPRLTSDPKPNTHRTLGILMDALLCWAIDEVSAPIDVVTFDNKIHALAPLPMQEARALLMRWCEALSPFDESPLALIAPLAIAHAESLIKDPDQPIEIQWTTPTLLNRPAYRRLLSHEPAIKDRHLHWVRELVIPLVQRFTGKPRNAF